MRDNHALQVAGYETLSLCSKDLARCMVTRLDEVPARGASGIVAS